MKVKAVLLCVVVLAFLSCDNINVFGSKDSAANPLPSLDEFYLVVVKKIDGTPYVGVSVEICFPTHNACYGSNGTDAAYQTNENGEVVIPASYPPSEYNELWLRIPSGVPTNQPFVVGFYQNPDWLPYGGYHRFEAIVSAP